MKIKIEYIVIAILLAIIVWLSKCDNTFISTGKTTTKVIEITKWDTFIEHDTIFKPKWKKYTVKVHDTIRDSFPYPVGTILAQTEDSLHIKNDSTDILVKYSILSENPLIKITKFIDYKVKRKEINTIVTNEVVRKHSLFLGSDIALGGNGFILANGSYEFEGKTQYNLGLGFNFRLQPIIKLGMSWQILK
tara:strand:+ start:486 stop:1058 length:573 start_codon:yes stop_codon:yes gene_type:complete